MACDNIQAYVLLDRHGREGSEPLFVGAALFGELNFNLQKGRKEYQQMRAANAGGREVSVMFSSLEPKMRAYSRFAIKHRRSLIPHVPQTVQTMHRFAC